MVAEWINDLQFGNFVATLNLEDWRRLDTECAGKMTEPTKYCILKYYISKAVEPHLLPALPCWKRFVLPSFKLV